MGYKVTLFGKVLRKMRLSRGEILYDMAQKLGVSCARISGIEHGTEEITEDMLNIIIVRYGLSDEEANELRRSAKETSVGANHSEQRLKDMEVQSEWISYLKR